MEPKSATAAANVPASTEENELTGPVVVAVHVEDEADRCAEPRFPQCSIR